MSLLKIEVYAYEHNRFMVKTNTAYGGLSLRIVQDNETIGKAIGDCAETALRTITDDHSWLLKQTAEISD